MPAGINDTHALVRWQERDALSQLRGQPVHFHFLLTSARLYSFWVAPTTAGHSGGYFGSGGGVSIVEGVDQPQDTRREGRTTK
jgi:hypothetical protein